MTENDPKNFFCFPEMMSRSNNKVRGQNLLSKMALEEISLATPGI